MAAAEIVGAAGLALDTATFLGDFGETGFVTLVAEEDALGD